MLAYELITEEVPSLKLSDTGEKVIGCMEDLRISHLPVVNQRGFMGMLAYSDMLDLNQPDKKISELNVSMTKAFVREHHHIFDVLKVIADYNVTAVAVLDDADHYLGVITADTLIQKISRMPFVHEPGAVIVLELNVRDYSLSQIAQIVEGNDAKILNLYLNRHPDTTKIEVTLKINKDDLSPILQTFQRYNYSVKSTFQHRQYSEDLKRRFDEFMHFLNI